jgi:hypothetical protein
MGFCHRQTFFATSPSWGPTHPPIQLILVDISLRVRQPESEASHSMTYSQECVELYFHSPINFIMWYLRAQGQFYLLIPILRIQQACANNLPNIHGIFLKCQCNSLACISRNVANEHTAVDLSQTLLE